MNRNLLSTCILVFVFIVRLPADWIPIAEFGEYNIEWGESELMDAGWAFQDGDYFGYSQCEDGTWDCSALRRVVGSPFGSSTGSGQSIEIRSGDPESEGVANSSTSTAIALPQEIPLGGKATIYIHFAIEDIAGERFFSLSDLVYESWDDQPPQSYGESGVIMKLSHDYELDVHQGGYVPARKEEGDPDANALEPSTWYEMWIQVDNQSKNSGDGLGSRYDLFIRGGHFGNGDPVHLTNTVQGFIDNGYTEWIFRRNEEEPVRTFNVIAQYGNPGSDPLGFGAVWINSLQMYPDEMTLSTPSNGSGSTWHGYPVTDGWARTDDWMGWLYVANDPWVYSYQLSWIYVPHVSASGGWIYKSR